MDFTVCYHYFDNVQIVAYFLYKASVYTVLSDNTILSKKDMAVYKVRTFLFFFGSSNNFFFGLLTNISIEILFLFLFYNFQSPFQRSRLTSFCPLKIKVKSALTPQSVILSTTKYRGKCLIKMGSVVFLFLAVKKDSLWPTSKHHSVKLQIFHLQGRTLDPVQQKCLGRERKKFT